MHALSQTAIKQSAGSRNQPTRVYRNTLYTCISPQVVGVGGSASSVVGELWDNEDLSRLHMIIVNTDVQASDTPLPACLSACLAQCSMPQQQHLQLMGDACTRPLGPFGVRQLSRALLGTAAATASNIVQCSVVVSERWLLSYADCAIHRVSTPRHRVRCVLLLPLLLLMQELSNTWLPDHDKLLIGGRTTKWASTQGDSRLGQVGIHDLCQLD
jgi:hypothetical protein